MTVNKNQFDDVTTDEHGSWSQICNEHAAALHVPERQLDNAGSGICGVIGCSKESDHYVDFS